METKIRQLIKEAMIAKNANKTKQTESRYQTLKNILETAQKIAKENKTTVSNEMFVDAAKKEIKQLNDLLAYCNDNEEKKNEIEYSISVAKELLPQMASESEIKNFILENKENAGNIGAMMKLLKEKFGQSLDGKMASQIVKEILK